jgi:protein phosphatase
MSYRWWSSCRTTTGRRRSINEDAYLSLDDIGLWVVADGMGGHARGDVASRIVIDALRDMDKPRSIDEFVLLARARVNRANRIVREQVLQSGPEQIMGSTVVLLIVYNREWRCLWAGDSRAYLMRDGRLVQITRDHSVVQEMIDKGQLRAEEAAAHPAANRITRAVGAQHNLNLDEAGSVLRDGDTILLCSDGLTKEVSEQELADVLDSYDCEEASRELVDLSLERGARDNVTVAVIQFEATTGLGERKRDDTAVNYDLPARPLHAGTGVPMSLMGTPA